MPTIATIGASGRDNYRLVALFSTGAKASDIILVSNRQEEFENPNIQYCRDLIERIDARILVAAFNASEIGTIDVSVER